MKSAKIISLNITLGSYQEVLEEIIALGVSKKPSYVCFANAHMTVEAARRDEVRKAVSGANIITADGMPVARAIRYKYGVQQDRIAGMDAMPGLFAMAERSGLSVFLFGTTDAVLKSIEEKLKVEFPSLRIAGMLSPPFEDDLQKQSDKYVQVMNDSEANLVMVALGCPKQEIWMATYSSGINAVLLGLGGAFPVYAETVTRAPVWMQRSSLEWLYRLVKEPVRLFSRYFSTNTYFLFRIFFEVLAHRWGGNKAHD